MSSSMQQNQRSHLGNTTDTKSKWTTTDPTTESMVSKMDRSESAATILPFKVCLVGNADVGKSSIVDRYVNGVFATQTQATLSAEFYTKIVQVLGPEGQPI